MTDKDLVALCHKGDKTAYASLVKRYQGLIFGLSYRLLQSPQEAEDVSQETFVRLYQQIRKNPSLDFLPYAKRVAANLCMDKHRQSKKEKNYLERFDKQLSFTRYTPEEASLDKEKRENLYLVFDTLPQMYREVLLLYYGGELPQKEIANKLKVPLTIVKNRLYRGKKLLREAFLKEKEVD